MKKNTQKKPPQHSRMPWWSIPTIAHSGVAYKQNPHLKVGEGSVVSG